MSTINREAHGEASDPVLEDLVAEITDKLQAGDPVDLQEYALRHPEHSGELRRLLPALELMAELGSSSGPKATQVRDPRCGIPTEARVLGDYRLIRELGRGGMGVVYEAEQLSLGRLVALKVLPFAATMEYRRLQRFRVEAQAAACLHHPNIVPVFGVGCDRGVHYYAMQLIEGQSLAEAIRDLRRLEGVEEAEASPAPTKTASLAESLRSGAFAPTASQLKPVILAASTEQEPDPQPTPDATVTMPTDAGPTGSRPSNPAPTPGSSTRDRAYIRSAARLGQQAAEALDHAHQHGILHRDIKPGNLMLDSAGRLWVADFGLARFQDDAGLTQTGDLLGTLRYMSPEQAMARSVVIDHRTDVYSLGVTLYELLTLRPAIDGGERGQVLRRIAEQEPTPLHRLNPAVPRDLATIVQKAMAKEAADRYATAGELAEDLGRYLEGQTIKARRPSLLDRASKLARRHKAIAASAVVMLILLLVGLAASNRMIWMERQVALREKGLAEDSARRAREASERAESERAVAQTISDFLLKGLLAQADPHNQPDRDIRLRTVLDRAATAFEEQFHGPPQIEAAIRRTIGRCYISLALYEEAGGHLERARQVSEVGLGAEHPDALAAKHDLAALYRHQGRLSEAEPLFLEVLAARRRVLGEEHTDTMDTRNSLAVLYLVMGNPSRAEPLLARVLEAHGREWGIEHPETLLAMTNLACAYQDLRKLPEAEALFVRALDAQRRVLGEEDPRTLFTKDRLAMVYRDLGKPTEAVALLVPVLEAHRRVQGEEHPDTLRTMDNLAHLYWDVGKTSEAESLLTRAVEASRRRSGEEGVVTLGLSSELAWMYREQGKPFEAEGLLLRFLSTLSRVQGEEHPQTIIAMNNLAVLYLRDLERPSEAEPLLARALRAARRVNVGDPGLANILYNLGAALFAQQKFAEAEPYLREALGLREKATPDDWMLFQTRNLLGGCLAGRGDWQEAEPLLLTGYEGMKAREASIPNGQKRRLIEAAERLAQFYEGRDKPDQAARWQGVASRLREQSAPR